jgi:hypothetical protein
MNTATMTTHYSLSSSNRPFTSPQPSSYSSTSSDTSLQQPIAIPATSAALGSPFLRAYPIELEAYNIPAPTFLSFLDELNRLMVVSPPVRVLGLAGDIVGLVPLATAQIVGGAVSAAATITNVGMSKGRSEMFIREANKKTFGPHGLKINIVKLEVVAKAAGIPILDAAGKIKRDTKLLAPLDDSSQDLSGQHRRLMALAPYTSPLEVTPETHKETPTNMIDKMHAYASERQRSSEEKKVLEKREKAARKASKDTDKAQRDYKKDMAKLNAEEDKVRRKEAKKPEKMESELRKLDKERAKVQREYEKEMSKTQGGSVKNDKEEVAVRKILWLLIQREGSASAQPQDTLQYGNSSAQYQDQLARYRARSQSQGSIHIPATGQYLNTGPYLGGVQYQRYHAQVQSREGLGVDAPPRYQESVGY